MFIHPIEAAKLNQKRWTHISLFMIKQMMKWQIMNPVMIFVLSIQPNTTLSTTSYKILDPKAVSHLTDPMKIAPIILDSSKLDPELFRLGNTKAWSYYDYIRLIFDVWTKFIMDFRSLTWSNCDEYLKNPPYFSIDLSNWRSTNEHDRSAIRNSFDQTKWKFEKWAYTQPPSLNPIYRPIY